MGRKVIVTSRGAASAMLVEESHRESVVKRLHDIEAGHGLHTESFKLVIGSVHAALSRDYEPMTKVFEGVIARTLRLVAKPSSGPHDSRICHPLWVA